MTSQDASNCSFMQVFKGYSNEKFSKSRSGGIRKGCHFLWKVYERGTFSIKNGILKGSRVGPWGGASPYKNLSSSPHPGICLDKNVLTIATYCKLKVAFVIL